MSELESSLAGHGFFKGLTAERLKELRPCSSLKDFGPGDFLLREGSRADRFYLIRKGLVAVELHAPGRSPLTLQTLGPHEILGWSWIVPPYRWSFDARALEPVSAVVFDALKLRSALERDPELAADILKRLVAAMGSRLMAARVQLLDLYAPRA